jgi:hypothetical protein
VVTGEQKELVALVVLASPPTEYVFMALAEYLLRRNKLNEEEEVPFSSFSNLVYLSLSHYSFWPLRIV